jgi:hypothetical protein
MPGLVSIFRQCPPPAATRYQTDAGGMAVHCKNPMKSFLKKHEKSSSM